jgi:hypothetical protein
MCSWKSHLLPHIVAPSPGLALERAAPSEVGDSPIDKRRRGRGPGAWLETARPNENNPAQFKRGGIDEGSGDAAAFPARGRVA